VPAGHDPRVPLPILRSTSEAPQGTRLRVRVADGAVGAVTDDGVETGAP
jgi:hypothetical protein